MYLGAIINPTASSFAPGGGVVNVGPEPVKSGGPSFGGGDISQEVITPPAPVPSDLEFGSESIEVKEDIAAPGRQDQPTGGDKKMNFLLIGGAALLAYFLFIRKKK